MLFHFDLIGKSLSADSDRDAGMMQITRGMACIIGDGPDFLIAVDDHPEWGISHVCFGTVSSVISRNESKDMPY